MSARDTLYVRVDATAATGLGHFTRCFALAQQWRDLRGAVHFVGAYGPRQVELLGAEGISTQPVAEPHPAPADLSRTLASIPPGSVVVLDGYEFDATYQRALARDRHLLVVDDFGHQHAYAGDALLNPNFSAGDVVYREAPARRLLGPKYALLRRDFRHQRARNAPVANSIGRLLVAFGGADVRNDTARLVPLIDEAAGGRVAMRVIVGPLNPHARALSALANLHERVALRFEPRDLRSEMLWSDLAITSAGSISAELAALGIPALLFAVADNQLAGARSIDAAGVARFGGDLREMNDNAVRTAVRRALDDVAGMAAMRSRGPALVDGDGVVRVCRFLREGTFD